MVWVSCLRRWSRGAREEQEGGILYLLQLASGAARSATDLASARSADVPGGFIAAIVDDQRRGLQLAVPAPIYPVVIINWVQYLGPPGPFSFPDSRDLLEVLGRLSWQREGGSLGDPPGPN